MPKELASQQPGYWSHRALVLRSGERLDYLYFNCPCGCLYGDCVPLSQTNPKSEHHWSWNGSVERPTLGPSLRRNTPCRWHGHLVDGVWSSCGDGAPLASNVYRAGMMPAPESHTTREGEHMSETESSAPAVEESAEPAPEGSAIPACKGSDDRNAHTWSATPTGDEPNLHTCIHCGDTLIEQ